MSSFFPPDATVRNALKQVLSNNPDACSAVTRWCLSLTPGEGAGESAAAIHPGGGGTRWEFSPKGTTAAVGARGRQTAPSARTAEARRSCVPAGAPAAQVSCLSCPLSRRGCRCVCFSQRAVVGRGGGKAENLHSALARREHMFLSFSCCLRITAQQLGGQCLCEIDQWPFSFYFVHPVVSIICWRGNGGCLLYWSLCIWSQYSPFQAAAENPLFSHWYHSLEHTNVVWLSNPLFHLLCVF